MIFVSTNEGFISHPLIKQDIITRREYQENIFINCLNKNCLVVIPTGLGKTIIALMLAVQRLTEIKDSKVIILAPTKPLVEQHYHSFLELTNLPNESLISLTGAILPEKRKELWTGIKIAFMTPQVLQNDLIAGLYSIKDVSLMIFDECHRAVGDYAYCFIAKKYRDISNYAQILGLTASPGSTEGKINEIKQNLFIDHIEIRTEKDLDVIPYIHNVENKWIKVKLPAKFLEIKKILEEKLKDCYRFLKENDLLPSYDILKINRKDLLKLNHLINRRISIAKDKDDKFQMFNAKKLVANAIRLSHMIELIETQGVSALKDYFEKNNEKIKKSTANKSLKELFIDKDFKRAQILTYELHSKGIIHPKIEKLKEILNCQLRENPSSRILVFCHFRDSVNNLVQIFKKDTLIKIHKFVGQATRGSDKGLTQKEQINLLREFKEGIYNTLVGTSVAEEGLDIEECDLVVFYDVVPSAIRSIQRRGRTGRKKEGKVYVLMAEDTRDEGYYWAEKTKEKSMKLSLEKIKNSEVHSKVGQLNLLNFMSQKANEETQENDENLLDLSSVKKIDDAQEFEIICDNRETASPVVRTLSLMGLKLKLEQLPVADYIVSEYVGIERKSSKDFNDSIIDGRLFNELIELTKQFSRPILVLEGDPLKNTNINENALYGAITSIIINLGISVYKTENSIETAKFLYHLARKEQTLTKSTFKLRFDKAPIENSRLLEHIIAGIPGVNTLRAKKLLKELKTIQNIFLADIPDLTKIENIGKKIATQIYKISRYRYKNDH
ncbi:MAG: DEAD/DEAH box helicase [Promethearchaeota archaeon]